ncbi:MAG: phosphatidate cytidylyltransferase [Gammaproteobacteria bacterium]|uniref:Phosphatidate cytidylyltransferase n=1 Tax=Shewanella scandinavica TaxID=3063538 RepID=A0ABU3FYH9_9GAMM|nr:MULTISPECIES: phosphatidate cytidylyltransferase [unclassified Shewanella]MBU1393290.1 phosphatidate cytidylyltransferase [Gammaproteobacteria bacterium]AUD59812.1 phosphatidate cytidylyltransferase [Shewanella sp. Pdp11]MBU1478254.1 phosphatidate cytidylyltransferase [Gammaproteobacteria bacterium]MBU2002825.1 phosphatidate cytidylyltransferase [Gammaproteobacteria bacterium]MBU2131548.1 phosphatidate cytidylyltransferase [Gammaproteobacteria bacterium]
MLKQRIITAIWLVPLVLGAIFLLPASYFAWALVGVFLIAAKEWGRIIDNQCDVTQWSFTCTVGILLVALNLIVPIDAVWLSHQLHPIYLAILYIGALWWLASLLLVVTYPKSAKFWQKNPMFKSMFGQLTLIPCFVALIALKSIGSQASPYFGPVLVLLVMLIVWAADSGAYFVGKAIGKTKLMPAVSPAKTLEGLLGGLATTMIVVAIVMYYSPEQELGLVVAVTLFVALVSALGDLSESMFKRAACIKDSGTILPGHGGVLDRIDSLTAALPVFTLIYIAFWM